MAVNKVEYGNQTLIDLTTDTVTESDVLEGVTFHNADGTVGTGNVKVPTNAKDITYDNEFYNDVDSMLTHLAMESANHGGSIRTLLSDMYSLRNVTVETLENGVTLEYGANGIGMIKFQGAPCSAVSAINTSRLEPSMSSLVNLVSGANRYIGSVNIENNTFNVFKMVTYGSAWVNTNASNETIFGVMPVKLKSLTTLSEE